MKKEKTFKKSVVKMKVLIDKNKLDKKQMPLYFENSGATVISKNHRGNQYKYELEIPRERIKDFLTSIRETEVFEYLKFKNEYIFTEMINENLIIWNKDSICQLFEESPYGAFHRKFVYYELSKLVYLLDNEMLQIEVVDFLEKFNDKSESNLRNVTIQLTNEIINVKESNDVLYGLDSNALYTLSTNGPGVCNKILEESNVDNCYLIGSENESFSIVYKLTKTKKYKKILREKKSKIEKFKQQMLYNQNERKEKWITNRNEKDFDLIPQKKNHYPSLFRWKNNDGQVVIGIFGSTVSKDETPKEVFEYKYNVKRFITTDSNGRDIKHIWKEKVEGNGEYVLVYQTIVTKNEVRYEYSGIPIKNSDYVKVFYQEEMIDYLNQFHKDNPIEVNIIFNRHDTDHNANAHYDYDSNTITYHLKMLYITIIRNIIEKGLRPEETLILIASHEMGHANKQLYPMYEKINTCIDKIPSMREIPLSFGEINVNRCEEKHLNILNGVIETLKPYSDEVVENEFAAWENGREYVPSYLQYAYDKDNWSVLSSSIRQEENHFYLLWLWKKEIESHLDYYKKNLELLGHGISIKVKKH